MYFCLKGPQSYLIPTWKFYKDIYKKKTNNLDKYFVNNVLNQEHEYIISLYTSYNKNRIAQHHITTIHVKKK